MELVPYIVLAILSVLMSGPKLRSPYDVLRRLSIPLLGVAYILRWQVTGTSINLPDIVVWVTLVMLGWWMIATLVSPYHYVGVSELSVHIGSVVFVMTGFDGVELDGLKVVMVGVVINCVYAVAQNVFRYEIFKKLSNVNHHYAIGFIGNQNMFGNFLVVNFFLSLMLVSESLWWLFVSGLIAYTIWLTRCRGSYIGLIVGAVFLGLMTKSDDVYTFLVILVTSLVIFSVVSDKGLANLGGRKSIFIGRNKTVGERLRYWRIAWEQIRRRPGFGVGLNCLKCNVPFIQMELNKKTNGKFMDPNGYKDPYPQKCHNDYLQMACDAGVVSALAYIVLIILALMSDADVILKAGLVAAATTGMFLHNLHIIPVNVWVLFILFACLRDGDSYILSWYITGVIVVVILATYKNLINETICGYYFQRAMRTKNGDDLLKGLKYVPTDGYCLVQGAGAHQVGKDSITALDLTMRGIYNYNGDIRLWELWLNAAKAHLVLGGLLSAEACTNRSLELNPNYKDAQEFLKTINNILIRGYQVKRENKNESKTNGS